MTIHFIDGRPVTEAEWFALLRQIARDEETDEMMRIAFRAMEESDGKAQGDVGTAERRLDGGVRGMGKGG